MKAMEVFYCFKSYCLCMYRLPLLFNGGITNGGNPNPSSMRVMIMQNQLRNLNLFIDLINYRKALFVFFF
jgi:hypothetical protein